MPEFKIEEDSLRREARFRVLSWGTVLFFAAVAVLLFVLGVYRVLSANSLFGFAFVSSVLASVIGASILACHEALHYAARQMVFVMDGNGIVRKRRGYPDVTIAFSEISTLSEELRWLIIRSVGFERKIAIPKTVRGYEALRAELAKHHPLSAPTKLPLQSTALLTVSVLSWAAVLWLRDVRAIIATGIVAVVTLAFGSYRVWTLLHCRSKSPLLWASLGFAWLAALFLIYLRVVHP